MLWTTCGDAAISPVKKQSLWLYFSCLARANVLSRSLGPKLEAKDPSEAKPSR